MLQKPDDSGFRRGFKTWCENVSLQHRKDLGLSQTDPIDLWNLAKKQGVIVWKANEVPGIDKDTLYVLTKEDPESWSALTLMEHGKRLIILNPASVPSRMNSDLAHELSHLIIGHDGTRIDITPDNLLMLHNYGKQHESEATWLAGCLLLPRSALLHIRRISMSIEETCRIYGISKDMLLFRINVTGVDRQLRSKERTIKK